MTTVVRSGRCDNCRRIKRKCDEGRPACSGCQSRKTECTYSYEVSKFIYQAKLVPEASQAISTVDPSASSHKNPVVLEIRSTKEPPTGDGLYRTFVFRQPPLNPSEKLSHEFHSVLYSSSRAGSRLKLWGQWLVDLGPRLGHNTLLDRAAACLIKGHSVKRSDSYPEALITSQRQYSQALILLRNGLAAGKVTVDIIAATRLLMALELMTGDDHINWLCHAYGAVHLFQAAGPSVIRDDDFAIMLFEATYVQAWQQGFVTGKPSVFDTPEWLAMATHLSNKLSPFCKPYSQHKFHFLTRLPRLVALVKALRDDLHNRELACQAGDVADELLHLVWGTSAVNGPLALEAIPTTAAEDKAYAPLSFQYDEKSFDVAMSSAMHSACKIMISGLCISLYACGAAHGMPPLEDLYAEEQQCAILICMMVQSAKQLVPYGASAILLPLQVAWGAYWRAQQLLNDEVMSMIDESTMVWLRDTGNALLSHVSSRPMTDVGLTMFTKRLMGGS